MDEQQQNDIQQDRSTGSQDLDRQLAEAKEEAQTNLNGWKRAQADLENFKKRKEEEIKETIDFAKEITTVKILPTLDTLAQMMRYAPSFAKASAGEPHQIEEFEKNYTNWLQGVEGTVKQIDGVLAELGIKRIEAKGKKFDPHLHEAVREVEGENGEEDGTILEEIQPGFELNGKVIRPSQVVISKKH